MKIIFFENAIFFRKTRKPVRKKGESLIRILFSGIFPLEEYEKAFSYAKKKDTLKVLFKIGE